MKKKKTVSTVALHILLLMGACIMIMPFLWMVLTSLKTVSESTSMNPFVFFPKALQWDNFKAVIQQNDFIRLYFNTFAMMFFRVLCAVLFSAMAAYAFARLNFPGKNFLFGLVLFQMMVPAQIFIIPQYLMVDRNEKYRLRTCISRTGKRIRHVSDAAVLYGPAKRIGGIRAAGWM